MRALIIQPDDDAPAGIVSSWLERREAEEDVYRIGAEARDCDAASYDLVVFLGSEAAAYDDAVPWLGEAERMLTEAVDADVPVLGICFGGQLLARALGGSVGRAERPEIGWIRLRTQDPALVPEGPWLGWHYDSFTPPPGAVLVAESAGAPHAFTIGRSLGIQFHPEVTTEIMEAWVRGARDRLARDGVDPDELLAASLEHDAGNHARAWRLLDAFIDRVARVERAA